MDTETEFYVRDVTQLEEFLYEQSSGFLKKEAGMFFDSFDLIFVTGSPKILPWLPRVKKLLVLFRMCLLTKKMVFACGLGFFFNSFMCSKFRKRNV